MIYNMRVFLNSSGNSLGCNKLAMMLLHEEPNLGLVEDMFQIGRIEEQRSPNFFQNGWP